MQLISSKVVLNRLQRGRRCKVRYEFTVEDNAGLIETIQIPPKIISVDVDVDSDMAATPVMERLERSDREALVAQLLKGVNVLRDATGALIAPRWTSYEATVRSVLQRVLVEEDPLQVFRAAALIDKLSDNQIAALLEVDQSVVDKIKARAAQWKGLVEQADSYTSVAEDGS